MILRSGWPARPYAKVSWPAPLKSASGSLMRFVIVSMPGDQPAHGPQRRRGCFNDLKRADMVALADKLGFDPGLLRRGAGRVAANLHPHKRRLAGPAFRAQFQLIGANGQAEAAEAPVIANQRSLLE